MKVHPSQAKQARLAEQYAALGRVGLMRPVEMKAKGDLPAKPDPVRG